MAVNTELSDTLLFRPCFSLFSRHVPLMFLCFVMHWQCFCSSLSIASGTSSPRKGVGFYWKHNNFFSNEYAAGYFPEAWLVLTKKTPLFCVRGSWLRQHSVCNLQSGGWGLLSALSLPPLPSLSPRPSPQACFGASSRAALCEVRFTARYELWYIMYIFLLTQILVARDPSKWACCFCYNWTSAGYEWVN